MYIPAAFVVHDRQENAAMIRNARLATLVTVSSEGLMTTPLPLRFSESEGELGILHGHIARAKPQWQHEPTGKAMVIFQGENAYFSPAWYPTKAETGRVVPTWNYVAVHAYGPVEFCDDPDRLLEVVTGLTNRFEADRREPRSVEDAPLAASKHNYVTSSESEFQSLALMRRRN